MGNWVRNILEVEGNALNIDFFEKSSKIINQHEFEILEKRANYALYSFGSNRVPCFDLIESLSYQYDLAFTLNYYEILDDIMGKKTYKNGNIIHEEEANFERFGIRNPLKHPTDLKYKHQEELRQTTTKIVPCLITVNVPLKKLLES